jgi:hypothetical protein
MLRRSVAVHLARLLKAHKFPGIGGGCSRIAPFARSMREFRNVA